MNEKAIEVGDELRVRGDEASKGRPATPFVTGVIVPDLLGVLQDGRCLASPAALSNRFVVPRSLVDPERAEHTTATLC